MTHIEHACSLVDTSLKHALEFGVFRGKSISLIRNKLDHSYEVFGFDSFEGLPENWTDSTGQVAGHGVCVKGMFSTGGNIPGVPGVKFFKGWFDKTLPEYLKIAQPIGLLHVDCDLYSSTKTVLYGLSEFIVPGTIIVFDEWFYNFSKDCSDHEQKCFYEWVADGQRGYELIDHDSGYPGVIEQQIVRITR